jgi:hypothetical protein
MTSCDDPYIGDESMSRPPAPKKARMTSAHASRAAVSSPTLNVIHVPSPTTGISSPDDGMRRVDGWRPCCAKSARGQSMAANAPRARRRTVSRRGSGSLLLIAC